MSGEACSGLCGMHCGEREDHAEISSRDADALHEWLAEATAGGSRSFTPRSSSRLRIEDPGNGGLIFRMTSWAAE